LIFLRAVLLGLELWRQRIDPVNASGSGPSHDDLCWDTP